MSLFSSKAKSEIEKLVEENDELKNTLHQVLQKHQNLVELENKLNEARKEFTEITNETERYKNDLKSAVIDFTSKTEEINALKETIKSLSEKKFSLESSVKEIETESQQNVEKVISEKQMEIEKLNEDLNDLHSSIEKLANEESSIKQSIANLRNEEEKLRAAFDQTAANFDTSELTERIDQLKLEENKKVESIKALDEKISLAEEIKFNLESSLSAIIGRLSEKEKFYSELINKRDSIGELLRERQKEFDEFESRYNFTKETISKLDDEVKKLTVKRNELSDETRNFEIVKNELQDKLLQLGNDEETLTESVNQKQKTIEELEKRKFEIEESHLKVENNFSQVLQKFTEELSSSKNKLSSLRQEILEKEKELSHKEKILLEKTTQVAEYGGLTKVLQKERAATEQLLSNLKQESSELSNSVLSLKDEATRQKLFIQQLKSETASLEIKKESFEKDIRQLFIQISENYSSLNDNKQKLVLETAQATRELEELKELIANQKNELRQLKTETANTEIKKEEYTAKISELIAMEKNLKFRILENEKKMNNDEGKNKN